MYICSLPTILSEGFSPLASSFLQTTPRPTVVFSPSPFPTCTVHHIHVRFQLESQLSHSNTFQSYQQFSKRTLLDANNLQRIVLQVTVKSVKSSQGKRDNKNPLVEWSLPRVPSQSITLPDVSAFSHLFHPLPWSLKDQGQDKSLQFQQLVPYIFRSKQNKILHLAFNCLYLLPKMCYPMVEIILFLVFS